MERKLTILTVISSLLIGCFVLPVNAWSRDTEYKQFLDKITSQGVQVDEFERFDNLNKERVKKFNDLIETIHNSYQITKNSSLNNLNLLKEDKITSKITAERQMAISQQRRETNASRITAFNYVAHTDGSKVYFKNGLTDKIENERVLDEFGNVSLKNTYNMNYSNDRLLRDYEAEITDELGNITYIQWEGAEYAKGSLFYGNNYGDNETNAYKTLTAYKRTETDHAGNTRTVTYNATDYKGKYIYQAETNIADSVYGNISFTQSNITYKDNKANQIYSYIEEGIGTDGRRYEKERLYTHYNKKDQITGYYEETTLYDYDNTTAINKTTTNVSFEYLETPHQFGRDVTAEPDKLRKSLITTTNISISGAKQTKTVTTNYEYDQEQNLVAAYADVDFQGQESKWWEHTDPAGNTLMRNEDEYGNITYSYINDSGNTVVVPEEDVTSTLKDGNHYQGTSEIQYEILAGRPLEKNVSTTTSYYGQQISPDELLRVETSNITYNNGLVNNIRRALSSYERKISSDPLRDPQNNHNTTKNIYTSYIYDNRGNLIDAFGEGTVQGWNYQDIKGWHREYTATFTQEYEVILGQALKTDYHEDIDYLIK
jgi:hypothetical protein